MRGVLLMQAFTSLGTLGVMSFTPSQLYRIHPSGQGLKTRVIQPNQRIQLDLQRTNKLQNSIDGEVTEERVIGDSLQNNAHPERYNQVWINTGLSVLCTIAFALGLNFIQGPNAALEFCTGYLVEESLSVDNLFVFLLIFEYFQVPQMYQNRVLKFGFLGAVVLRFLFIALGAVAIKKIRAVLLVFSGILFFSGFKIFFEGDDAEEENLSDNAILKLSRQIVDSTDEYDGDKFFTVASDGVRKATPLLLVLVCLELSDLVFAVDSVPAIFGVTEDPFIVFTSNMFAIVSLRSLYTIIANAVEDLSYLQPAVGLVLIFVGGKLSASFFGYEISNVVSLGTISTLLAGGVSLSLLDQQKRPNEIRDKK